jgi:MFS family permease
MAYVLLDSISAGILSNVPLMALKALHASDTQIQIPIAMTSAGLFSSVITGAIMARRRKMGFILVPGLAGALAMLIMAWVRTSLWFLIAAGAVSILDFAMRPAIPSILRIVYPDDCRSHVAGTLRQYASLLFPASAILFASLLSLSGTHIRAMMTFQLTLAGVANLCGFLSFRMLPDRGDGSDSEATPQVGHYDGKWLRASLAPLRDQAFCRFLGSFFLYSLGNLMFMGVVAPFFAHDLEYGYVRATLFIHVIPAATAFLMAGRLTSWFDRTSVFRAYALVTLLWGLDPILMAFAPAAWWPLVAFARVLRGPATVGSLVIAVYTGVHSFARPGADTSRYMSALYLVNGVTRLVGPIITAFLLGYLSHREILVLGGGCVLVSSAAFWKSDTFRVIPKPQRLVHGDEVGYS